MELHKAPLFIVSTEDIVISEFKDVQPLNIIKKQQTFDTNELMLEMIKKSSNQSIKNIYQEDQKSKQMNKDQQFNQRMSERPILIDIQSNDNLGINSVRQNIERIIINTEQVDQNNQGNIQSPQENGDYNQKMLQRVNGEGRYQIYLFIIFFFLWFFVSWLLVGMSFFFDNAYSCKSSQYSSEKDCQKYICSLAPSQRRNQIANHSKSISFQFQNYMICSEYENQIPILQSMLYIGALFGFLFIPTIADNSGRKEGLKIAMIISIVSSALFSIADSPIVIGFGTNPAITLAYSFINEQCLGKYRQRFGVGVQIGLALGISLIALIFLTGLTWRQITYLLTGLLALTFIFMLLILKETPAYLIKKDAQETLQVLNEIAKINDRPAINAEQFEVLRPKEVLIQQSVEVGVMDLLRHNSLRWISISSGMVFFGIQVIYYSTILNLDNIGFSKTINQIIFGLSEIAGYVGAQFIIDKVLRKKYSFIGLGLSSGICIALGILLIFKTQSNKLAFNWIETVGLVINRAIQSLHS